MPLLEGLYPAAEKYGPISLPGSSPVDNWSLTYIYACLCHNTTSSSGSCRDDPCLFIDWLDITQYVKKKNEEKTLRVHETSY